MRGVLTDFKFWVFPFNIVMIHKYSTTGFVLICTSIVVKVYLYFTFTI